MVNKENLDYYVVGGAVRDEIMGNEPNDFDYVVVGSSPEDMKERGFIPVEGADFPVYLDKDSVDEGEQGDEYALARTERKDGEGYTGFDVYYGEDVSLEDDLKRRDFTINSMAKDVDKGEIIDPHGGKEDINREVLRHVSEAFSEDPLRVIRMARFSARFDFDVAEETMDLAREVSPEIRNVDNMRIIREMVKAMKQADKPGKFFEVCKEADVFEYIFPEIKKMTEVPAGKPNYHAEGSVFDHSVMVMNELHDIRGNNPFELIGAFFHDVGKIETYEEDDPYNHYGHEKKGVDVVEKIYEKFGPFNKDILRHMKISCKEHMRIKRFPEMNPGKIIDVTKNYEPDKMDFLIDLAVADSRGRIPSSEIDEEEIRYINKLSRIAIDNIDGEYLKYKHGENFHEKWEGEKIGNVVKSDRCEKMKNIKKIMETEWFKGV